MGRKPGNVWESERLEYLKELIERPYTAKEIANLLNIKFSTSFVKSSILWAFKHYNIKRTHNMKRILMGKNSGYRHGYHWTEQDLEFIRRNKNHLTDKEIATTLGKLHNRKIDVSGITRYIKKFGWYRTKEDISTTKSRVQRSSPKVRAHMKKLGKEMTSNPEMNKRRALGMKKSRYYVEQKSKHAISLSRNPEVIKKRIMSQTETWLKPEIREKISGSNSPNWKGGKIRYYGKTWQIQRKLTRIRDNNSCVDCGKNRMDYGRTLDVHHIKPFRLFMEEFKANNAKTDLKMWQVADTICKNANHLNNLMTLCPKCHTKRDNLLNKMLNLNKKGY